MYIPPSVFIPRTTFPVSSLPFLFIALCFSFERPFLSSARPPTYTCCCLLVGRRVARRGCGGPAGVAWTEINIRRASTYSCLPSRSRPCPPPYICLYVVESPLSRPATLPPQPRSSQLANVVLSCLLLRLVLSGLHRLLHGVLPPSRRLLHRRLPSLILPTPRSLEGGLTNTHARARANTSARPRAPANRAFLYRVCFHM